MDLLVYSETDLLRTRILADFRTICKHAVACGHPTNFGFRGTVRAGAVIFKLVLEGESCVVRRAAVHTRRALGVQKRTAVANCEACRWAHYHGTNLNRRTCPFVAQRVVVVRSSLRGADG